MKNPLNAEEKRTLVNSDGGRIVKGGVGIFFICEKEKSARICAEAKNRELVQLDDGCWLVKDDPGPVQSGSES